MPNFPAPDTRYPIILPDGSAYPGTAFLKAVIDHPRWEIGEYTYANCFDPPQNWAERLAPYLFEFSPERLVVGKFCQIADDVMFITASANHRYDGFSSYPFAAIDRAGFENRASMPGPGSNTIIGNDVWIGQGARIMPGADIGSGCIVGAGAVVSGRVEPYTIVVGNPAEPLRRRFDVATIERLLEIAWWDWPIEKVVTNEAAICGTDIDMLAAIRV